MKRVRTRLLLVAALAVGVGALLSTRFLSCEQETSAGWSKYAGNPVLGGLLGTVFDVSVLKEDGLYRMWFSWRPQKSIALVESSDGIHWSRPVIVLGPRPSSGWEEQVNRPSVVKGPGGYHLWYTGQAQGKSWIGHAASPDGVAWQRTGQAPVLSPDQPWEKGAVMSPHVLWDEAEQLYRLWYSAGEQSEPDAIGYAASPDGLSWSKLPAPVFRPAAGEAWDSLKVTAGQVIPHENGYVMFYIGFDHPRRAQIGLASSPDGLHGWQRHPHNPIIRRCGLLHWDSGSVYKPYAILDGDRWLLWYNGRIWLYEQIGLATHAGLDLGFDRE